MKDQILTSKGEELSRVLGEVLQPKTKQHNELGERKHVFTTSCSKCGLDMQKAGVPRSFPTKHFKEPCEFADPIPLDWPNAMKYRDWAVEKFGVETYTAYLIIMIVNDNPELSSFNDKQVVFALATKVLPKHHIQAAALCVERNAPA